MPSKTYSEIVGRKPTHTFDQVMAASGEYFGGGNGFAASAFANKYALRDPFGGDTQFAEATPADMHDRLAAQLARIDLGFEFGSELTSTALEGPSLGGPETLLGKIATVDARFEERFGVWRAAVDRFQRLVPQGSPMYAMGNRFTLSSLSNCVVVDSPSDNLSSISEVGKNLMNLYKRRAGVGVDISTLRPHLSPVNNAAITSTGAFSFSDYYSFVTRMVGQNGRRGALMLTIDVKHPDADRFTTMKQDTSKVTGANISLRVNDEFMKAVEADDEFTMCWPCDLDVEAYLAATEGSWKELPAETGPWTNSQTGEVEQKATAVASRVFVPAIARHARKGTVRVVKARDLWDLICDTARRTAEPGLLFWDNYTANLPAHHYPGFESKSTNPCCFGSESDVFVQTKAGLKEIKQVTKDDLVWIDRDGVWAPTSGYFSAGQAVVYRVRLSNGEELDVTSNHKLAKVKPKRSGTTNDQSAFDLTMLKDLKIGDRIALSVDAVRDGGWGTLGTRNEGLVLGWLTGDGCLSFRAAHDVHPHAYLSFWKDEADVVRRMAEALASVTGVTYKDTGYDDGHGNNVRRLVSGVLFRQLTEKYETNLWKFKNGHNDMLFKASREFVQAYLAAYFTADGTVTATATNSRWCVQLGSVDKARLLQVKALLCALGVRSSVGLAKAAARTRIRDRVYECADLYRLTISGKSNLRAFKESVGFVSEKKAQALQALVDQFDGGNGIEKGRHHVDIVSIERHDVQEVGCIEVPEHHRFTANGVISGNSEICLSPFDSCRLLSVNLTGYVRGKFTSEANFDYDAFAQDVRLGQRAMDNIVELEMEALRAIQAGSDEDAERWLWGKLLEAATNGRRTGLGLHALGDCLTQLGVRYDSDTGIAVADAIYRVYMEAAYDESVNLAVERGAFPAFDWEIDQRCDFIQRLPEALKARMAVHGRRNISILTNAPTGTVSAMCQTSSGIEPTFRFFYTRRKKINPSDTQARVDFVDQNGDKWQEFAMTEKVLTDYFEAHPERARLLDDIIATVKGKTDEETFNLRHDALLDALPEGFVSSDKIDPRKRVEIQGVMQAYVDHGISSTVNLPKGTTTETIQEIYLESWKRGLKGVTVYVDGCRTGVLVTGGGAATPSNDEIVDNHAPKRPDEGLPCDIHHVGVEGKKWLVFVGLMKGRPFEVFGGLAEKHTTTVGEGGEETVETASLLPKNAKRGVLVKRKKEVYDLKVCTPDDLESWLEGGDLDSCDIHSSIEDVVNAFDEGDYSKDTKYISALLRHGMPIAEIVKLLRKDKASSIVSFSKVMARILSRYVIDESTGLPVDPASVCKSGNCM